MDEIVKIEINFPTVVDLSVSQMRLLDSIVRDICDSNVPEGYSMWPSESGSKITYMAMTADEEKERDRQGLSPIKFDDSIYSISCAIKKKTPRNRKFIGGKEVIRDENKEEEKEKG